MGRISKAAQACRIAEARALLSQGVTVKDLSTRWRIEPVATRAWLARNIHGYQPNRRRGRFRKAARFKMYGNEPAWQTADPSTLTADQLDQALRLNINPARYAWLLLCPKGGNAIGWQGGNSIG